MSQYDVLAMTTGQEVKDEIHKVMSQCTSKFSEGSYASLHIPFDDLKYHVNALDDRVWQESRHDEAKYFSDIRSLLYRFEKICDGNISEAAIDWYNILRLYFPEKGYTLPMITPSMLGSGSAVSRPQMYPMSVTVPSMLGNGSVVSPPKINTRSAPTEEDDDNDNPPANPGTTKKRGSPTKVEGDCLFAPGVDDPVAAMEKKIAETEAESLAHLQATAQATATSSTAPPPPPPPQVQPKPAPPKPVPQAVIDASFLGSILLEASGNTPPKVVPHTSTKPVASFKPSPAPAQKTMVVGTSVPSVSSKTPSQPAVSAGLLKTPAASVQEDMAMDTSEPPTSVPVQALSAPLHEDMAMDATPTPSHLTTPRPAAPSAFIKAPSAPSQDEMVIDTATAPAFPITPQPAAISLSVKPLTAPIQGDLAMDTSEPVTSPTMASQVSLPSFSIKPLLATIPDVMVVDTPEPTSTRPIAPQPLVPSFSNQPSTAPAQQDMMLDRPEPVTSSFMASRPVLPSFSVKSLLAGLPEMAAVDTSAPTASQSSTFQPIFQAISISQPSFKALGAAKISQPEQPKSASVLFPPSTTEGGSSSSNTEPLQFEGRRLRPEEVERADVVDDPARRADDATLAARPRRKPRASRGNVAALGAPDKEPVSTQGVVASVPASNPGTEEHVEAAKPAEVVEEGPTAAPAPTVEKRADMVVPAKATSIVQEVSAKATQTEGPVPGDTPANDSKLDQILAIVLDLQKAKTEAERRHEQEKAAAELRHKQDVQAIKQAMEEMEIRLGAKIDEQKRTSADLQQQLATVQQKLDESLKEREQPVAAQAEPVAVAETQPVESPRSQQQVIAPVAISPKKTESQQAPATLTETSPPQDPTIFEPTALRAGELRVQQSIVVDNHSTLLSDLLSILSLTDTPEAQRSSHAENLAHLFSFASQFPANNGFSSLPQVVRDAFYRWLASFHGATAARNLWTDASPGSLIGSLVADMCALELVGRKHKMLDTAYDMLRQISKSGGAHVDGWLRSCRDMFSEYLHAVKDLLGMLCGSKIEVQMSMFEQEEDARLREEWSEVGEQYDWALGGGWDMQVDDYYAGWGVGCL